MTFVLNLIIKENIIIDNFIRIHNENNEYQFNCTCNKYYCKHLDFIIHKISYSIKYNLDSLNYHNNNFTVIGFNDIEYLKIPFDNIVYEHSTILRFIRDTFSITCSHNSMNCEQCNYSITNLITNYLYKKECYSKSDSGMMIQDVSDVMNNLKI